jgi:hypothetical protein
MLLTRAKVFSDMYNGFDWYGRILEVREVRVFIPQLFSLAELRC